MKEKGLGVMVVAMITQAQYRLIRRRHHELGGNITMTALKTDHSRTTVRKYTQEDLPPAARHQPRTHRTRIDPLADVWPRMEAELVRDPELQARTLFEHFLDRPDSGLRSCHLRTVQRRVRRWRKAHPVREPEVFFPQEETPGRRMQLDWTCATDLGVTIQGQPLPHLLCHAVLPYSNQAWIERCQSESLLSLKQGLCGALTEWGGVPGEMQTDNSSAATHRLRRFGVERAFNPRYLDLCAHFGLTPRTTQIRKPNQNGDVESANGHFKTALDQALRLRGSREFACEADYDGFVTALVRKRNLRDPERWAQERAQLRPVLATCPPLFDETEARVTRNAVVVVNRKSYSVPSRLIGERLRVRIHAREVVVLHAGVEVARHTRCGPQGAVDWRHVIAHLVRKPGAFARYVHRDEMFPGLIWRVWHERLLARFGDPTRADREYLLGLRLALGEGLTRVEEILDGGLGKGKDSTVPTLEWIKAGLGLPPPLTPMVSLPTIDLSGYDQLIGGSLHEG